jgi:hypothetical protein
MAVLRIVLAVIGIFLALFAFRVLRGYWSGSIARFGRRRG